MTRQRLCGVLVAGSLLAGLGWLLAGVAHGQKKVVVMPAAQVVIQRGGAIIGMPGQPTPGGTTAASALSGIKIIEKSELRQVINVGRECIRDKAWEEAVTALQALLDHKEDHYVQVRDKDASGKEMLRWTSVKFEANNLLGSMPADGLDVYEVRFGAKAKKQLDLAKEKGDRELLAEVAQRYCHTKAGIEANELLATLFLARGQNFMAALRYEKLLAMDAERAKLSDLTYYKAALAFHRAGDEKNAAKAWKKVEAGIGGGSLRVGEKLVSVDKLRTILDESVGNQQVNPYDWIMVRGDLRNTAQANGSPPLLDSLLWHRPLLNDKKQERGSDPKDIRLIGEDEEKAQGWVKSAITKMREQNLPVLSGFFPIATKGLIIYRTHSGIRAVAIKEVTSKGRTYKPGDIVWNSFKFYAGLANLIDQNSSTLPIVEQWLKGNAQPQPNQFGGFQPGVMPGGQTYANLPGLMGTLFENSTIGTLSTDHTFVYAIDDLSVPPPYGYNPYMVQQGNMGEIRKYVTQNILMAFNLEQNGKLAWQLGGSEDPQFSDSHFLGAPVAVGGKLYVLNEKNPTGGAPNNVNAAEAELRLVCIDPTKRTAHGGAAIVEPIQLLGMVQPPNRVAYDISRRTSAVHLAFGEGILVCPTNAGEVFGVDLMSRALVWSYPYRDAAHVAPFQTNMNGPFFGGPGMPAQRPPVPLGGSALGNWKSAPPAIAEGKVVFTAPDASAVHCINLRDGKPIWKSAQKEGDLYLAGVYGGKVLIVGKNSIRALSLANGSQLWTITTGDVPSGQGVASKDIYYLPLSKGEILAVNIDRGTIKAHNRAAGDAAKTPPGNLVFYEGAVLSLTPTDVVAYPQLAARLDEASIALRTDPDNLEKLTNHGELLLKDGQVQAAVVDLEKVVARKTEGALGQRAKDRLYEALTDLLQVNFNANADKYLGVYRELCDAANGDQERQVRQAKYFRIVGQGREAQGNLVEAFRMYKDFGALPIHSTTGGVADLDDPSHKVPTNVWLRGRISAMIAKADAKQRAPLEAKIADEWKAVKAKKDLEAIRSFVGMFDVPFTVGREARLHLAEAIIERNDKTAFLEAEMNLEQLLTPSLRDDPAIGGRALATLALLEQKKGTAGAVETAAGYYRELAQRFAKAVVKDGKTGEDLFNELPPKIFLPYLQQPRSPWDGVPIGARKMGPGGFTGSVQFMLSPTGDLSPFARQHRLEFDTSNAYNTEVRLVDIVARRDRWKQPLGQVGNTNSQGFPALYQNNLNVPYGPNARHRVYHIKGHLIVAQIGLTAFCFDGDSGKVLWKVPLAANMANQGNFTVQAIGGDAEGNPHLTAFFPNFGQQRQLTVGQIGAVEASYVAIVNHEGLIVHDPLHDAVLWKKSDVDATSQIFGDAEYLFLLGGGEGDALRHGQVLRAIDGAMLAKVPDFGPVYHDRIRIMGRRILATGAGTPGKSGLTLRLYDIIEGKNVWSKNFDASASVLRTEDPALTGVIDGKGNVTVLNAETGAVVLTGNALHGKIGPEDFKGLHHPLLLADSERFYIALNKPLDGTKVGMSHNNFSNGLRCQPTNGWVLALHRKDGTVKVKGQDRPFKKGDFAWHSFMPLDHQMMIVEQFEQLPVLLFSARYQPIAQGAGMGVGWRSYTQSLSKKDGKFVYDDGPTDNNASPHNFGFSVDAQRGTFNVLGYRDVVQHYIDDGRKLPPATGTGAMKSGLPPGGQFGNGGLAPPAIRINRNVGGAIIVAPLAPPAAPPALPKPPPNAPKK